MDYPRRELIENVAGRSNVSLLISRQTGTRNWRHVTATLLVAESCAVSDGSTEQNYCFPGILYKEGRVSENIAADFRNYLDALYDHLYSPEEIIGYIYAILHAPTYRRRYAEFLRMDFPRIPFAASAEDFEALSALGWALVEAHLMRNLPAAGLGQLVGRGTNVVDEVRWSKDDRRFAINATQGFAPVPEEVWAFHVGGYQVLDKYLKSRRGRMLSLDEITHIGRIADALAFTVSQMTTIDLAYLRAFPERG